MATPQLSLVSSVALMTTYSFLRSESLDSLETYCTGLCQIATELCARNSFLRYVTMKEEASSDTSTSDTSTSDKDRRVRFEDVTDEPEDLSTAGHDKGDPPSECPGSESNDETRDAHTQSSAICQRSRSKQATVHGTAQCSPDVSFELQANSTVKIGGNMYSHVRVSDDARLHLGDSITINNYNRDSKEADEEHIVARVEITQEFLMTLSAAVGLVRALLQTTTGLFLLLQVTMSAYRLPKQINDELVTFEDALGRFQRIDLLFIKDLPEFTQRLKSDFHGTSGSRRILEMKYRLFDRVKGNYIVDPQFPPPFTSVFKQGRHVQMSIHFEWSEVSDEQCPRCGVVQECEVNAETICAECGFNYRGQVENARVEEEMEDEDATLDAVNNARPESQRQRDMPSSFSRVTISKQPARSTKRRPALQTRPERNSHHGSSHVAQQYVVEDVNGRKTYYDTREEAEAKARRLKQQQQIEAAEAYQATTSALTVKRAQKSQRREHRKPKSHDPGSKRKSTTTESIQITRDGTTFSIPINTTLQIRQTEEGETWVIGSSSPPRKHSYYGDTSKSCP
jgi:hypothetical protein